MFIASYNPKSIGDVLVVVLRPDTIQQKSEKKGNVVRIFDAESNTTLGYNFLVFQLCWRTYKDMERNN